VWQGLSPKIMEWIRTAAYIALGSVFGANLRYFVSDWLARHQTASFPFGTLAVNTTGSLLLGFFLIWTTDRVLVLPQIRLFFAVGFCSSYTTFSSYSFETFRMLEQGHYWDAGTNFLVNNLFCFICVLIGAAVARAL
jgi:CrcB protein